MIDPTDDSVYYSCSQSSGGGTHSCQGRRDTATGTQNFTVTNNGFRAGQRYTTDAPLVIDPNVPPLAPTARSRRTPLRRRQLHRALAQPRRRVHGDQPDRHDPGRPDRPDRRAARGRSRPSEIDIGLYTNLYGAVTALAPAKSPTPVPYAQVIYAGTDTGLVWKTADAGATWTRMQGLPARWVNSIIADPDNPNHAYIAFSGFRQGDDAANVWETTNGGATWQNISHNMPNGPVEMIEYDPKGNVLFAATDVGVFDRKDGDSVLVQDQRRPAERADDGPQAVRRRQGADRGDVRAQQFKLPLSVDATDGGGAAAACPATLALTLGRRRQLRRLPPGVARDYTATTTANVVSTAGDATLSVSEPGRLVNGSFSLPSRCGSSSRRRRGRRRSPTTR